MIRETIIIGKTLWLALRKQLIGDYGDPGTNCEVILLSNPKIHIVACTNGDLVNVTIIYDPLEVVLDIRRAREQVGHEYLRKGRNAISVPLA